MEQQFRYGEANLAIWRIHIDATGCVYAQVGIPHVGDFEKFHTSPRDYQNDVFKGYRGYYLTMGDIDMPISEWQPYVREVKFIFSMLLSLLYKETTNELYINTGTTCTVEEHIEYCKRKLESWNVYIAK
ncbi:hypothetical protein [Bacillus thuringiensis]